MKNHLESQFVKLCQVAYDLDLICDNTLKVEAIMDEIVELVELYPKYRSLFVRLFLEIIDGKYNAPYYLVPFCMQKLKFEEVRSKVLEEFEKDQNTEYFRRSMNFFSDILRAYDSP